MAKAKQKTGEAKFQVPGGQATPAPPVGTSLGKFGINLGQFVSQFNERTREYNGIPIPVVVTVYSDRSFEFITKSPPASALPPGMSALSPPIAPSTAAIGSRNAASRPRSSSTST